MSKSNRINFILNTYEQKLAIDSRLNELFNCLKISELIRTDAEYSKQKLKEKLNNTFGGLKNDLSNLEVKMYKKVEHELLKDQIDKPIRNIEMEINQLIGNLNSLTMLNDTEKLLCIKSIDASIERIKNSLKSIENHKKCNVDNLESSQHHFNTVLRSQIEKIQNSIRSESINLNSEPFNKPEDTDYKHWLLQPSQKDDSKLKKSNSFEFINFNQDDIEILEDFDGLAINNCDLDDLMNDENNFSIQKRFETSSNSDKNCVAKLFNEIYSKPIDYWLLKTKTN